jgi:hypothetical protein
MQTTGKTLNLLINILSYPHFLFSQKIRAKYNYNGVGGMVVVVVVGDQGAEPRFRLHCNH